MSKTTMRTATFDEAVSFSEKKWGITNIMPVTSEDQVAHFCQTRRQKQVHLYEYIHDTGKESIQLKIGFCEACETAYVNLKK